MFLEINPQNPEPEKIEQVVEVLKNGGIIVYPTDTIYGLGCDIFNKKAIEKIYQLKKRERKKPLSIICSDPKQIAEYALLSDYAFRLLKKLLPGPYTFILKAKHKTPQSFIAKNKTVGVRIPADKICLALVKKLGNPIITTSLNLSGQEVFTNPEELSKELLNKIDLIIDVGSLSAEPSTVIDLSNSLPVILRQGKGKLPLKI
ncbi:MAG: L-threonylcarbamoyladenylate synthase [Candidatus Parcubacteria bacterium]|nr:L-threonylcarbamoyladenylate synthase [Candidatus Parcubacteria bacterium]